MKVLLSGVNGFCGGYLGRHLHENGHEVVGLARRMSKSVPYRFFYADLAEALPSPLYDEDFDAVVHPAGALPQSTTKFLDFYRNNTILTKNLIQFTKEKNIKKFIFFSTIGIYGEFREENIEEESDRINQDYYGLTKYICEFLLKEESVNFDHISLRMPGIVGPGAGSCWLTATIDKFLKNEDVTIYAPDFISKNFLHVHDIACFVERLLYKETYGCSEVNLACAEGIKILELMEYIKQETTSSSNIIVGNCERKPFCLDAAKALQLGFTPMSPRQIVNRYLSDLGNLHSQER